MLVLTLIKSKYGKNCLAWLGMRNKSETKLISEQTNIRTVEYCNRSENKTIVKDPRMSHGIHASSYKNTFKMLRRYKRFVCFVFWRGRGDDACRGTVFTWYVKFIRNCSIAHMNVSVQTCDVSKIGARWENPTPGTRHIRSCQGRGKNAFGKK